MSCAVTFLYLYTAEFLFRCKSGKSNCTFVGQGLCPCPTMQQSALVFIQERHSRLVPYDVQIGFLLPCAVKLKITVPIFCMTIKTPDLLSGVKFNCVFYCKVRFIIFCVGIICIGLIYVYHMTHMILGVFYCTARSARLPVVICNYMAAAVNHISVAFRKNSAVVVIADINHL